MSKKVGKYLAEIQLKQYAFTKLELNMHEEWNDQISEEKIPLRVQFKVGIGFLDEESELVNDGGIELSCMVNNDEEVKETTPFEILAVMRGEFHAEISQSREALSSLLSINGVAILFPFLRSAIADLSRIGNFPPLLLPIINVHAMMDDNNGSDE